MSGAIAAGLLAAFVPLDWLPIRQVAVRSAITRIGEAQVLLRRPATLFAMIAWTFVQFASLTACFWTTFRAIAAPIPASGAVITAALTDFSLLLRFTPAAVGTFEGAVYYAVHPLGVTLAHAILAALLVRLALAAIFLPFGSIAFIHQVQRLGLTASAAPSKPSK
jgi:uncharacterized membrane protein YbhN (UPF0104 family)